MLPLYRNISSFEGCDSVYPRTLVASITPSPKTSKPYGSVSRFCNVCTSFSELYVSPVYGTITSPRLKLNSGFRDAIRSARIPGFDLQKGPYQPLESLKVLCKHLSHRIVFLYRILIKIWRACFLHIGYLKILLTKRVFFGNMKFCYIFFVFRLQCRHTFLGHTNNWPVCKLLPYNTGF